MRNPKRYNQFSHYLKEKFGAKVYKITIDAGFSCPNRDGTISNCGCIFCDDGGSFSQAHSNRLSIEEQVKIGAETLKNRFKAEKFMSYFQAFSNTYKPVRELEKIYKASLTHPDIVGLSIGTRPDCIDNEKLKLISSFTPDYYTWIEYGLQTVHDKTLIKINRGHDYKCFLEAYEKTKNAGINICLHVILNLFETYDEMMETAKTIAKLEPEGVKIHMLCALEGTKITEMYPSSLLFRQKKQTNCKFSSSVYRLNYFLFLSHLQINQLYQPHLSEFQVSLLYRPFPHLTILSF